MSSDVHASESALSLTDDALTSIEIGNGVSIFDGPPNELAVGEQEELVDIQKNTECRITIEKIHNDNTFKESEYIELLSDVILLVSEKYGICPLRVLEGVEANIMEKETTSQ